MHSAYCVCSIEVGMKVVENEWKCSEKEKEDSKRHMFPAKLKWPIYNKNDAESQNGPEEGQTVP